MTFLIELEVPNYLNHEHFMHGTSSNGVVFHIVFNSTEEMCKMSLGWISQTEKNIRLIFNKAFVNGMKIELNHKALSVESEFKAKPKDKIEIYASIYEVIKL